MSDILADYRIWKSQQEERSITHSKRCHMWPRHEPCMIHRLAAALDAARLTDEERRAVAAAITYMAPVGNYDSSVQNTLRGLLKRHFPVPENAAE